MLRISPDLAGTGRVVLKHNPMAGDGFGGSGDIQTMDITSGEFCNVKPPETRPRQGWCLVFSTNCRGDKWSFETYGYTEPSRRNELKGSKIVDRLATALLRIRPEGGRIFVNSQGAFYKAPEKRFTQFVEFLWDDKTVDDCEDCDDPEDLGEVEAPDGWLNIDATKNIDYPVREQGRYGSHPTHDDFGDESEP